MVWLTIPFILGALTVLQTGLNRQFGENNGLSFAVAVNGGVLCLIALGLMAIGYWQPALMPEYVRARLEGYRFEAWHLLPGAFGFLMVFFMPWAVRYVGAAPAFMIFVAAQMSASVLWDLRFGDGQILWNRIAGLVLCLAGAFIYSWAKP